MTDLVDMHAHVLPGIDDGPADLEAALDMARAAAAGGTRVLAATPHLRSDFPDVHLHQLADRWRQVRDAMDREGIPLRLVLGAEVSLVWALEASYDDLVLATYGQRGTDLLIETPVTTVAGIDQHLFHLRTQGFRITLAHPERSVEFRNDRRRLQDLADQGVLLQINSSSLIGASRIPELRQFAQLLCHEGLIHALASDGHSTTWRPITALAEGAKAAAELVGEGRAEWMTCSVPAAVIDGRELPDAPEIAGRKSRRLFGRRRASGAHS